MIPKNRVPTHPGEILAEEFLRPLGVTQVELASHIGVPVQRVNEIVRGKRGVTPSTAWLLAEAFETTPQFWRAILLRRCRCSDLRRRVRNARECEQREVDPECVRHECCVDEQKCNHPKAEVTPHHH